MVIKFHIFSGIINIKFIKINNNKKFSIFLKEYDNIVKYEVL